MEVLKEWTVFLRCFVRLDSKQSVTKGPDLNIFYRSSFGYFVFNVRIRTVLKFRTVPCKAVLWIRIRPDPNYFAGSEIETQIRILA